MLLNTSPTAIGVTVCWRIRRKHAWFSAGVGIFHPEHAEFFDALAEARRFNGRQAVVHVVQQMFIEANLLRTASNSFGVKSRYFSVDHSCSSGQSPLVAGS
jgi:hypothetical protein